MQLLKCTSGIRKSKPLLPKIILSRFVTAGWSVGVASLESIKQLIPAERQAATLPGVLLLAQERTPPEHAGLGQILATFTAKQVQDFSAVPSVTTGHLCQRRRKGKSTSTPGLSAQRELRGSRLPAAAAASGWDGRCGGARRCSLPLSTPPCPWWLLSHTSQMPSWQRRRRQEQQSCQPGSPALWQRQRRQRDVGSFPPAAE